MSYEITALGSTHRIFASENPDFTKAVELFRLFDDSRIDNIDSHMAISKMDRKFMLTVHGSAGHKFTVNAVILACMYFSPTMIDTLAYDAVSGTWDLEPNKEFVIGDAVRTPFEYICGLFDPNNACRREILDLFLHVGGCDIDRISNGEPHIFCKALQYIKSKTSVP